MSQYYAKPYESFGGSIHFKVDLSIYTTKVVDTLKFSKKD